MCAYTGILQHSQPAEHREGAGDPQRRHALGHDPGPGEFRPVPPVRARLHPAGPGSEEPTSGGHDGGLQ